MKGIRRIGCTFLAITVLLTVLSGCGKVDKGLLGKVEASFIELESAESGGWRRETYLSSAKEDEALAQSAETWFRPSGVGKDWYIGSLTYGEGGTVQMKSELAQKDGVWYQRFSVGGEDAAWAPARSMPELDGQGFPGMDLMDDAKHYEFFRKEADGSLAFAYSQAGLDAYYALLVAQAEEQSKIPAVLDGQPMSEEVRASMGAVS